MSTPAVQVSQSRKAKKSAKKAQAVSDQATQVTQVTLASQVTPVNKPIPTGPANQTNPVISRYMQTSKKSQQKPPNKPLPYFVNGQAFQGSRSADSEKDQSSTRSSKRASKGKAHSRASLNTQCKIEFVEATELTLKRETAVDTQFDELLGAAIDVTLADVEVPKVIGNGKGKEAEQVEVDSEKSSSDSEVIFVSAKSSEAVKQSNQSVLMSSSKIALQHAGQPKESQVKKSLPQHIIDLQSDDVHWGEDGQPPHKASSKQSKSKQSKTKKSKQQQQQIAPAAQNLMMELASDMFSDVINPQDMAAFVQSMAQMDLPSDDSGCETDLMLDFLEMALSDDDLLFSDDSIPSSVSSDTWREMKAQRKEKVLLDLEAMADSDTESTSTSGSFDQSDSPDEMPEASTSKVPVMDAYDRMLQAQWESDRKTKTALKREREAERVRNLLDPFSARHSSQSNRKSNRKSKGRKSDREEANQWVTNTLRDMNEQIKRFFEDDKKQSLSLPPVQKHIRARIHQLADAYNLSSKSFGAGAQRFTVLLKTKKSGIHVNKKKVAWVLGQRDTSHSDLHSARSARTESRSRRSTGGQKSFTSGHANNLVPRPIAETNVGLNLLSSIGWSSGQTIGLSGTALAAPLVAVARTAGAGLGS